MEVKQKLTQSEYYALEFARARHDDEGSISEDDFDDIFTTIKQQSKFIDYENQDTLFTLSKMFTVLFNDNSELVIWAKHTSVGNPYYGFSVRYKIMTATRTLR